MKTIYKIKKFFRNFGRVKEEKLNTVDDIYVASTCRIAVIISVFIELFEFFLLTRAIITKSNYLFKNPRITAYFISYLALFAASVLAQFLVITFQKEFIRNKKKLLAVIYIFTGFILTWGLVISYLDLESNQPFPTIVFLTIVMGIFTGVIGRPKIVVPTLSILFVASNLAFAYLATDGQYWFHFGYFFNSITFFIIVGVISTYNYSTKLREWTLRLEAKEVNERLAILAETDCLTQLGNRMNFEENMARQANECICNGLNILYLQLDIDDFKYFNDHYGQTTGDMILIEVAKVIKSISSASFRLGGDEFFLAVPCMTYDSAIDIITVLQEGLMKIKLKDARFKSVTASIGAFFGDPNKPFSEILKLTDDAVYYIKGKGKNDYYLINS